MEIYDAPGYCLLNMKSREIQFADRMEARRVPFLGCANELILALIRR